VESCARELLFLDPTIRPHSPGYTRPTHQPACLSSSNSCSSSSIEFALICRPRTLQTRHGATGHRVVDVVVRAIFFDQAPALFKLALQQQRHDLARAIEQAVVRQ